MDDQNSGSTDSSSDDVCNPYDMNSTDFNADLYMNKVCLGLVITFQMLILMFSLFTN